MTVRKVCGIPSNLVGTCDDEWGHDGSMHQNAGDGFHARAYEDEHRRRQNKRAKRRRVRR